jgi:O-antigen ligase
MTNILKAIHFESTQNMFRTFANHLLVVIAFFLPISYDAVQSGFFILIILLIFQKNPLTLIKNALANKVVLAFLMLWLLHIIGITYSENFSISSHYAKGMTFLLYPLLVIIFTEYRFLPRIFSAFILGVFLSELLSYAFFFEILTSPIPQSFGGFALACKNNPSPFTYHIEYGYILAITSAFILQRLLAKTSKGEKILFTLFFTTITLNLFFNSARTGYLLFFISNGIVLASYYKRLILKKLHLIVPFVLILLVIAWTSSSNMQKKYHETLNSISAMYYEHNFDSSIGVRFNFIRMGVSTLMESHPLIGFGTGMHGITVYHEAIKENETGIVNWLYSTGQGTGVILFTDCEYNSILLQFGFIGLLIYLNLFFQIYRFKQTDSTLKTTQNMILWSSIFYAISQSLLFGVLVPFLFVVLLTFTLVNKEALYTNPLSKLTPSRIFIYILGAAGLFILCKIT